MADRKPHPERRVDVADVDDIIGIASELEARDAERLSEAQLREVAAELGVAEHHVAPAIAELQRRRDEAAAQAARANKRKKTLMFVVGGVVALLLVWGLSVNASLGEELARVAQLRAQVVNVVERQSATRAQWETAPEGPARSAELSGAENRVRLERRRHDEAAAAYNGRAGSFPVSLWAAIFGRPTRLPLSNEPGGM
jgi:hypothetical protein